MFFLYKNGNFSVLTMEIFVFFRRNIKLYTLVNCFAYVKLTQINKNLTNALISLLKIRESRLRLAAA